MRRRRRWCRAAEESGERESQAVSWTKPTRADYEVRALLVPRVSFSVKQSVEVVRRRSSFSALRPLRCSPTRDKMGKKNSKLKQDTIDRLIAETYCEYSFFKLGKKHALIKK